MHTTAISEKGSRPTNQDRYLIHTDGQGQFLAVADGMGGHSGGETAASMVMTDLAGQRFARGELPAMLVAAVRESSEHIRTIADKCPELDGMGTTLTAAFIDQGLLNWVHVGDSRLYLYRDRTLMQITKDQTMVQGLIDEGEISADESKKHPLRHMLDQCVGCPECRPESGTLRLQARDRILLTTDGFHDALTHDIIEKFMAADGDLEQLARTLVREALTRGEGSDNITLLLAIQE